MNINYPAATCTLVQAIDILRNQPTVTVAALQLSDVAVAQISFGITHPWPAQLTARPELLAHRNTANKLSVLYWLASLASLSLWRAVVGNA